MRALTEKLLSVGNQQNWDFVQTKSPPKGIREIERGVLEALQSPLDFPSLDQAIIGSDHVAIAVCGEGEFVTPVVKATTEYLRTLLVDGEVFAVIAENSYSEIFEAATSTTTGSILDTVNLKKHHASKRDGIAYLGPDAGGEPISANRDLVECDFVVPIVFVDSAYGTPDLQFANRFSGEKAANKKKKKGDRTQQQIKHAEELVRSIGIFFGVVVKILPDGNVDSIEAGSWPSLVRSCEEFVENRWQLEPKNADVLVATIENNDVDRTIESINQAICVADQVCPTGEIVLLDLPLHSSIGSSDEGHVRVRQDADLKEEAKEVISRRRIHCFNHESSGNAWEQLGFGCTDELDDLLHWLEKFDSVYCVRNIHLVQAKKSKSKHPN